MFNRQVFSFLKKVLIFLVDRLYKEWGYILGNGRSYGEKASERGDLYAKQIIENIIHDRANKYDPYMLNENAAISYGRSSLVLGKAHVTGLKTLHRTNICSLTEEGNRLFMTANLGAGPLTYHREIVFRFGDFEQKAAVLASLINIKVSLDFSVEKETGRDGFLLNFAITELNGFKLSINGSGYFDWITNLFFSFWTLILGKIIRNLLENELEKYILNRLPKYQFPVEGTTYRIERKLKNRYEGIKNGETSFSESFCIQQSHKTPKSPKMLLTNNSVPGHNSVGYRNVKDFRSNLGVTKTSECFPETSNKMTTKTNNYLPVQSLDYCSESLNENSSDEVSKDESEEEFDRISEISRKTRKLSMSLNIITKKLDLANKITSSWSKEANLPNCLNILEDFSLLDRNIPEKSNDSDELEYYSSESAHTVTSPLSTSFENKQWSLNCGRLRKLKKYKREDFSGELKVPNRDQREISSEGADENPRQSQLLEEIFSEIQERSCKNNLDGNAYDMGIRLPTRIDNCDFSPLTKLESSQINENVIEQSRRETETFLNLIRDFDSERESQIEYLERMFNGKKRKKSEDSEENTPFSIKDVYCQSPEENFSDQNFDLKLCGTEMLQNEPLMSCTVDEFEKCVNTPADVFSPDHECKIKNTESKSQHFNRRFSRNRGVKTPGIQYISNPKDKVDGRNLYMSNTMSDLLKQKLIHDKKRLDLESDNEMISDRSDNSEKHENEASEKIPFNYVKAYSEESKDSQLAADEGYSADNSTPSEELPFEGEYDRLTEISTDALGISKLQKAIRGKTDSLYGATNLQSQERSLRDQLEECLNESEVEYRDSSIAELKLNENSNENSSEEMSPRTLLHDLQEEIITQTRKLVSDAVLDSDQESSEYSGCPILRYKNGYEKDKSTCNEAIRILNEVNQFLRRDSEKDLEEVSRQNTEDPNLSMKRHSPIDYESLGYFGYPSDLETETSETYNEQKPESDSH